MAIVPKIAVVILNWNGRNFLEQFLPSVSASTYSDFTIIVADNASSDSSIVFLEENYPSIRIIKLTKNFGFARGYNEALKQVVADYYVLLNSDVEVTPDWLEPMVKLLEADPSIAACQPKLLAYHNKNQFEYAGAAGGWIDSYGYPFSKGRVFEDCEQDLGQYDIAAPIFWASGASLFIRANVYHQLKGFDDFFFAHQEEIDLCWRAQLAGYKIYSCPSSIVYHVGGGTLPKGNARKVFLNFRNNWIMLSKNLPLSKKLLVLPIRYALDIVSGLKAFLAGDRTYFGAILKAHFAFLKWFFLHQKQSVFPVNKKQKLSGVFKGNIAWLYFVKKKKTFQQIVDKTL